MWTSIEQNIYVFVQMPKDLDPLLFSSHASSSNVIREKKTITNLFLHVESIQTCFCLFKYERKME